MTVSAAVEQQSPQSGDTPATPCAAPTSFFRSSVTFAAVSLAAYLISFLKTVLVTRYFGTTAAMDAFSIAVLVPNLLGALLCGGTASALIPALSAAAHAGDDERSNNFRASFILFGAGSLLLSILLGLLSEPVLHILASKFDPAHFALAVHLLRLASPLLFFNALYAYGSAELLSRRKYAAVAAAPAVSTLLAIAIILGFHGDGVTVLVWALVLGTALQALAVAWPAWRATSSLRPLHLWKPSVLRVLTSQAPLIAVSAFGVANVFIDQAVAGLLPVGSVSAFNYASSLNAVVMQTVVMAVGWVALPEFSALAASGDFARLKERARVAIIGTVLVAAPVCALVMVLGGSAIRILLQHGAFTAESTHTVSIVWIGYAIGLVPVSVGMLGARMINAVQAHSVLFKVAAISLPLNAVLDLILMRSLGVFGISLSTSFVYLLSATILFFALERRIGNVLGAATAYVVMRVLFATLIAAIPLIGVRYFMGDAPVANAAGLILFITALLLCCTWMQLTPYFPERLRVALNTSRSLATEGLHGA